MREVHYVTVQIGENRIVEGFYTIAGDQITMTYQDGSPVLVNNETVQMNLSDSTTPRMLAGRMTREIRKALAGETVEGFTGPLRLPVASFA